MSATPIANGVAVSVGGQKWVGQSGTVDGVSVDAATGTLSVHTQAGEHAPFDPDRKIRAELQGSHNYVRGEEIHLSATVNVSSASVLSNLEWNTIAQVHQADTRRADGTAVEAPPLFEADVLTDTNGRTVLQIRGSTGTGIPGANNVPPYRVLAEVPFSLDTNHSFEFKVVDGHGGPGRISVWLDGAVVCDLQNINTGFEYVDLLANDYLVRGAPQSTAAYLKIGNYGGVGSGTVPAGTQMFFTMGNINNYLSEVSPVRLTTSIDDTQLKAGETGKVTFTFSEAVTGFDLSDVTVTGGLLSNLVAVNASTYTALFTPSANTATQGSVSVSTGSYTGLANNAGLANQVSFNVDTVGNDTTPPVFQSATANGTAVVLTYNKPLDALNPPPASAFVVTADGAAIDVGAVSVDSVNRTVTLTLNTGVTSGQAVTVAYADPTSGDDAAALQDLAGNDAASLSARSIGNLTPDLSPPVFQSATVNQSSLVMAYGEALDPANPPPSSAFGVTVDGVAVGVAGVAVSGTARTVTLTLATAVTPGQEVTVSYLDPSTGNDARAIQDVAGNDATTLPATGVANTTPGTIPGRVINDTDLSHQITGGGGNDTIRGNGGDDTIYGGAGNDYISGGAGNDVLIGGPGTDTIYGGAGADRFVFQSLVDFGPASAPDIFEFIASDGDLIDISAIDANTTAAGKQGFTFIGTAAFSGQAGQLRYQRGSQGGTLLVSADLDGDSQSDFQFLVGASSLVAGNFLLGSDTPPADTTPPAFQSASVNGTSLVLSYDEALDAANAPAAGAFAVMAGNNPVAVTGVSVNGTNRTVTLTLATAVTAGQAVTIAYSDPSTGNDPLAIQDLAGNDALTLPVTPVTNTTSPPADTTSPTVVITASDTQLTAGESTLLTFSFSEPVTGFTLDDVTPTGGQLSELSRVNTSTYTALFTPTANTTVQGGASVAASSYADEAGNAGVAGSVGLSIDTAPPRFLSASVNGASLVLSYDDVLDAASAPAAGAFAVTAGGSPVAVSSVSVNGTNRTVTLTLATAVTAGQAVTVAYSDPTTTNDPLAIQDLAGNDALTLPSTSVTNTTSPAADTTPPTVVITASDTQLTAGESTLLTFTFSEPVTGFSLDDVTPTGGQLSALSRVNDSLYTALFTPTANTTVQGGASVAAASYADLAGNEGAAGRVGLSIDTAPPAFQSASVNGSSLVLSYDEALDAANAPAAGAFAVTAGGSPMTVTGVSVSSANRTVTLTLASAVTAGQAVTIAYSDPSTGNDPLAIQDLAGNDALTLPVTPVTNTTSPPADTTSPTVVITASDTQLTAGESTLLTFTFSEPVTGFTLDDVTPTGGQLSELSRVNTSTYTALFTPTANTTVQGGASVAASSYADEAGNAGVAGSVGLSIDTAPPRFLSATVNGASLVLSYDDVLDTASAPAAGAFAVTAGGSPMTVTGVSVSSANRTVTLTLATAVTAGQAVTVAYSDPSAGNDPFAIQDLAGNDALTLPVTPVTNTTSPPADTTPPAFQSASVNGASLVLTYNEALDAANAPAAGAFAVKVGTSTVAVSGVSVSSANRTVTLTLASAVTSGQAVTVAYTDPTANNDVLAIQDLAGNDAATLPATSVTNTTSPPADTTPPAFQSASVNGASLVLTYSEALDAANAPAASAFAVKVGTSTVAVSGVSVSSANRTVTLTLATAVTAGQAVTVAYTDPSTANDALAIQDLAGNDAATFAAKSVTNATPAAAPGQTINGSEAANVITGGTGNDTLRGNGGDDTINGGAGNDYISGGTGNDVLIGGPGTDTVYGGAGADRFVFQSLADFGPANALDSIELITGDGDTVDLSAIDANSTVTGLQRFSFIGTAAFTGQAGQLRYQKGTGAQSGTLVVSADLNGDKQADFQFLAGGSTSLSAANFILGT